MSFVRTELLTTNTSYGISTSTCKALSHIMVFLFATHIQTPIGGVGNQRNDADQRARIRDQGCEGKGEKRRASHQGATKEPPRRQPWCMYVTLLASSLRSEHSMKFSFPGLSTILYYNILYYTILYCTILYCNILYHKVQCSF